MLTSIGDLQKSMSTSIADSIRNVKMSTLDNEGKYAFIDAEANGYRSALAGAVDPEKIQEYGQLLISSLDQSWALLADQQRQDTQAEYIRLYEEAQAAINERLDAARQSTLDDQESLSATIKQAVIESWSSAANLVSQAGETIPERIQIDVNINGSGGTEVGVYTDIAGG